jgi:antitoxin MazE
MNVTQSLQKWGNGTGVRIPKKVADAAHLHLRQQLVITLQNDSIVLTPIVEKKKQTLETLLKGVTPNMVGGEFDWGKDVGAEQYE